MNGIYDGVITKPELNEETLTHYGIPKKVHKYIDKYLKNGKWIYRYKSKAQEKLAKIDRFGKNPEDITDVKQLPALPKMRFKTGKKDFGKADSHSGQTGLKNVSTTKVNITKKPRSRKKTTASGKVKVYKRSIK